MATLNELIYNIRNLAAGGILSDDQLISNRQMAFIINYTRAFLIKKDLDKKKSINPDIIQDLGCVPVQPVDKAECCELIVDCLILRTVDPLPKTIALNHSNPITFVGLLDGSESFDFISQARSRWTQYETYTANYRRAYLKNGHLYVSNDLLLEDINVQGVFEDPLAAAKYHNCNGEPCFSFDSTYPIEESMIKALTQSIITDELGIVARTKQDNFNNAKDDTNQT